MEPTQKAKLNIILSISSFVAFLISSFSGIVLWLILPYGSKLKLSRESLKANIFWGMHRQEWMNIHIIFGLIFVALIITLIVLHWDWIKNLPKLIKENFFFK